MYTYNILETDNGRAYYVNGIHVDRPVFRRMLELEIKATEPCIAVCKGLEEQSRSLAKTFRDMRDGKASFSLTNEERAFCRDAEIATRREAREHAQRASEAIAWIEDCKEMLED